MLSQRGKQVLYRCAKSGVDNADSGVGCYAMQPGNYETFSTFFDPLIRDYHGATADSKHVTDWDTSGVGEGGVLDVTKLGLEELSMRVRVGRNLKQYNLPGMMDKAERAIKGVDKPVEADGADAPASFFTAPGPDYMDDALAIEPDWSHFDTDLRH